jgi:hypothetical protein
MKKQRSLIGICARSRCLWVALAAGILTTFAFGASGDEGCAANAETRRLDYWVGNWTMGNGADKTMSKVSLSMDRCVFVEHWENGKGHVTEKTFAYSPEDKNWYGMFVDNQGRVHVFVDGKISSEGAEFRGTSRGPNGETVLNRLKVVRVSADKLEEIWEKSTDNGSSWVTSYRAEYSREK